jgi:predicted TIM-barrel fold metal-dependent hydrolase
MFANRIVLGEGVAAPRFRWVPFDDPLMLPLDTRNEAARTPDTRSLYPREAALLQRYLRDLQITALPPTLDEYVNTVVRPTLEKQKNGGAVAIKFEAAYLRPLDFAEPSNANARITYTRFAKGGAPPRGEYKNLQDYLFRVIGREAGKLGLAVHIHVFDNFGGFYNATGSQPIQLEPVFNDSTLRGTNFVIVHGGWPHVGQTAAMMAKPNVYADISMMDLALPPSQVAGALRLWLSEWPEKVLFGSDAFDGGPDLSWGEVAALGTSSARKALAMALTGMMLDGEITRERAQQLARMVLRENAAALYKLESK